MNNTTKLIINAITFGVIVGGPIVGICFLGKKVKEVAEKVKEAAEKVKEAKEYLVENE